MATTVLIGVVQFCFLRSVYTAVLSLLLARDVEHEVDDVAILHLWNRQL